MTVTLEKPLRAVPPGKIYPVDYPAGTEVSGRLAAIAIETGCARRPTERKDDKPRGRR